MAVSKILLFYVFTPLVDPEAIRLWQRDLCRSLDLRGRILVSPDGINATVGGELSAVKHYARAVREYGPFKDVDLKWSDGTGLTAEPGPAGHLESLDFPKLVVKVRDEIVTFGVPEELQVDAGGVVGGGTHLEPEQLHELMAARDDVVLFDGRNAYEAQIGKFAGAVVPQIRTTTELVEQLDAGVFDDLKHKPVVTYCTGGVRCEVLTSLMKARGFDEVYQLSGGVVRYGERFKNDGLWEGSLYVFDGRMKVDFSPGAKVIGHCVACGSATSHMENCTDEDCPEQLVVCEDCVAAGASHCVA